MVTVREVINQWQVFLWNLNLIPIYYTYRLSANPWHSYVEPYFKKHLDMLQSIPSPERILSSFLHNGEIISCILYASAILQTKILNHFYLYMYNDMIFITLSRVNLNQNFSHEVPVFHVIIKSMTNNPWEVWIFQKLIASSSFTLRFNANLQFYHVFHMSTFLGNPSFFPQEVNLKWSIHWVKWSHLVRQN